MYGLKQAAILVFNSLVTNLSKAGYQSIMNTLGMREHIKRTTKYCLYVNNFDVKYFSKEDGEHLLYALQNDYKVTKDWEDKLFCSLAIDWHYGQGYVDISMPKYIKDSIKRFQHEFCARNQFSPHEHTPPIFGEPGERQYIKSHDTSPILDYKCIHLVQSIVGTFL